MDQLFIPQKINVGFQNRSDTYTQKLAYVIYYDLKGVLRKEKSWNSWRDHNIPNVELANDPTEGFVLNKGVGGGRSSWNHRNEYIRVYDPRDFEFEISVANLLFILRECDCSRGKGLEGKFVYAWDGTELVLLPERSAEFQQSQKFTSLQDKQVHVKDLVPGVTYTTKKQKQLVFLGRFDYYQVMQIGGYTRKKDCIPVVKKFIFWDGERIVPLDDVKDIAAVVQSDPVPNFADLVQFFYKSSHGSPVVGLELRKSTTSDHQFYTWFCEDETRPGVYIEYYQRELSRPQQTSSLVYLKKGKKEKKWVLVSESHRSLAYRTEADRQRDRWGHQEGTIRKWREETNLALWAKLESGSEFRVQLGSLCPERKDENGAED